MDFSAPPAWTMAISASNPFIQNLKKKITVSTYKIYETTWVEACESVPH